MSSSRRKAWIATSSPGLRFASAASNPACPGAGRRQRRSHHRSDAAPCAAPLRAVRDGGVIVIALAARMRASRAPRVFRASRLRLCLSRSAGRSSIVTRASGQRLQRIRAFDAASRRNGVPARDPGLFGEASMPSPRRRLGESVAPPQRAHDVIEDFLLGLLADQTGPGTARQAPLT